MTLRTLATLDRFSKAPRAASPTSPRALFVPIDDVHGALLSLVESATASVAVALYALTDADLLVALLAKHQAGVALQVTLDRSQADGHIEAPLLRAHPFPTGVVAIGDSERGAIIHHKVMIVDALDVCTGSTNWSESGEYLEDNDLIVVRDASLAATYIARLTALHQWVLAHPPGTRALPLLSDAEQEDP